MTLPRETSEQATALVEAVARMRAAQRAYFRHKNSAALAESKRLEREVDRLLEELSNKQGQMF